MSLPQLDYTLLFIIILGVAIWEVFRNLSIDFLIKWFATMESGMDFRDLVATDELRWKARNYSASESLCLQRKWETWNGDYFEWRNVPVVSHDEPDQG